MQSSHSRRMVPNLTSHPIPKCLRKKNPHWPSRMSPNSKLLTVLGQGKGVSTHARNAQSVCSTIILRNSQATNFGIPNCDNRIIFISEKDLLQEKIPNYLNFCVDFTLQNRAT